jgi:hypothetical protein
LTGPLSRALRRQLFVRQAGYIECGTGGHDLRLKLAHAYVHL